MDCPVAPGPRVSRPLFSMKSAHLSSWTLPSLWLTPAEPVDSGCLRFSSGRFLAFPWDLSESFVSDDITHVQ